MSKELTIEEHFKELEKVFELEFRPHLVGHKTSLDKFYFHFKSIASLTPKGDGELGKVKELVEAILIIGARRANDSLQHDTAKELIKQHIDSLSNRVINLFPSAPKGDEWISVEDRLPEDLESVLAVHIEAGGICIANYDYETKKWQSETHPEVIEVLITHWQPLPSPPVTIKK